MKRYLHQIILIILALCSSCANNTSEEENERTFVKLEIWEDIQEAVRENNIDYLLEISKDTLVCIECNDGESLIGKEVFYANYMDQMKRPKNKDYTIYVDQFEGKSGLEKQYRINYAGESGNAKYNTIYTLVESRHGVKFEGVFTVP